MNLCLTTNTMNGALLSFTNISKSHITFTTFHELCVNNKALKHNPQTKNTHGYSLRRHAFVALLFLYSYTLITCVSANGTSGQKAYTIQHTVTKYRKFNALSCTARIATSAQWHTG